MSSAAVVIGALRVKLKSMFYLTTLHARWGTADDSMNPLPPWPVFSCPLLSNTNIKAMKLSSVTDGLCCCVSVQPEVQSSGSIIVQKVAVRL